MDTPMLKIPEVAARLSVSDSFVYAIIAEGRLKHYRLGKGQGGIRVSEEHLQDYLRGAEKGGESCSPQPAERRKYRHLT